MRSCSLCQSNRNKNAGLSHEGLSLNRYVDDSCRILILNGASLGVALSFQASLIQPIISLASCRGQFCANAKYILSIADLEQQPISSTSPQRWLPQRSTFPSSRSVRQSIPPSLHCYLPRNATRKTPWDCGREQRQRGLWTGQRLLAMLT